jgi:hypothetical protein
MKLMLRDSQDRPLTIFQHQKDTWNSTKSLLKQELIKQLSQTNEPDKANYSETVHVQKEGSEGLNIVIG